MNTTRPNTNNPRRYIPSEEIAKRTPMTTVEHFDLAYIPGVGYRPSQTCKTLETITTKDGSIFRRECNAWSCTYSNSAGDKKMGPPTWLFDYWENSDTTGLNR